MSRIVGIDSSWMLLGTNRGKVRKRIFPDPAVNWDTDGAKVRVILAIPCKENSISKYFCANSPIKPVAEKRQIESHHPPVVLPVQEVVCTIHRPGHKQSRQCRQDVAVPVDGHTSQGKRSTQQ